MCGELKLYYILFAIFWTLVKYFDEENKCVKVLTKIQTKMSTLIEKELLYHLRKCNSMFYSVLPQFYFLLFVLPRLLTIVSPPPLKIWEGSILLLLKISQSKFIEEILNKTKMDP